MLGFQMTIGKFFWFLLYMLLSYTYFTLMGMMTVAITPNIDLASGLSFLLFLFWNIFSDFIIGREVLLKQNQPLNLITFFTIITMQT